MQPKEANTDIADSIYVFHLYDNFKYAVVHYIICPSYVKPLTFTVYKEY